MSKKEKKKKNADETLEIVRKILDYNKIAQNLFQRASKVDERKSKLKFDKKKNQNQRLKKVLQRGKNKKMKGLLKLKKKKKKINNELFKHYFISYQKPSDIYKKLRETKGKINEDQADLIKEILGKRKKKIKICLKINLQLN